MVLSSPQKAFQSKYRIPYNKPFLTGRELEYIQQAVQQGQISGNGAFTKRCHEWFRKRYGFQHNLLTTSCTDALEMCALLLDIGPRDEVILPAYTFVSTANAFALRGAKLRFADSMAANPNICPNSVEKLITKKTKAIVIVHYGGSACDMERLLQIAKAHNIAIVEDAAHAIDSFYKGAPLGSLGTLGTFSFHETKNIFCGEGGLLVVNDPALWQRAEILWEKGTNRAAFARGETQKYCWIDLGSSFLPPEVTSAFLMSQLEHITEIQAKRVKIWHGYNERVRDLVERGCFSLPEVPEYATVNGHLFAILTRDIEQRDALIDLFEEKLVKAIFHYLPLNESPYFTKGKKPVVLPNARRYAETLVRLPFFYEITESEMDEVVGVLREFYK